jgi:23S rRNA pseudouridine1911/1915/1917 synthase
MSAGERRVDLSVGVGAGARLDAYIAAAVPDLSREGACRLIAGGLVTVNGRAARKSQRVAVGDRIAVTIPPPVAVECRAEPIPLAIHHEDGHLLVVDKPRGMLTHPVGRRTSGTLVNALLAHCTSLSGIGGELRPGIVHRLDRDTSGLIVVAKSDRAHRALADQFRSRSVSKEYLAIVHGCPKHAAGRIDVPLGRDRGAHDRRRVDPRRGKPALTEYRTVSRHGRYTLLSVTLHTGRTHQIRVHLAHIRHPVVGDPLYGGRQPPPGFSGLALHSHRLAFRHPVTGRVVSFESPLPADMLALLALRQPTPDVVSL